MRKPTLNGTVHKAIRAEYAMLRTPLTVLDERVLSRLGAESKVRSVVGLGLGKLDAAAARLLHERPHADDQGDAAETRSAQAGSSAAGLAETASAPAEPKSAPAKPAAARSTRAKAPKAEPTPAAEEIDAEEVEQVAEHLLEEQEEHPLAGELADDEELRRVQAELRAKHQVEAQHDRG